jgi:hypothetical protein
MHDLWCSTRNNISCFAQMHICTTILAGTDIKIPDLHPTTWMTNVLDDSICNERERYIILCGMWSCSRNDRNHGKSPITMKLAIDWALDVCFHLILSGGRDEPSDSPKELRWQKPPAGFVKINNDGAFVSETLSGATGSVIRREDGSSVTAMARQLPSVASALVAEAENPATTAIAATASYSRNRLSGIPRFSSVANLKRYYSGSDHRLYVVLGCSHKTNRKCCSSHLC